MPIWLSLAVFLLALPAHAQESIRFGVDTATPVRRELSRAEVRSTFGLWAQELGSKFQIPVTVTFYEDEGAMRRDFLAGKIDAVNADALTFVRYFKPGELVDGYSTVMQGGWNLAIYSVPTLRSLDDLVGKRIALLDQDEVSEMYLETLCLRHYGRGCNHVFSDMQRVASSNQALMRVFFGKADLALVQSNGYALSVEMNPQLAKSLRQLTELPLPSLYYAFFRAGFDETLRQRTLSVIPTLHTYPRGRQLLDIFKIERLAIARPAELQPVIDLEREYRHLKSRMVHP